MRLCCSLPGSDANRSESGAPLRRRCAARASDRACVPACVRVSVRAREEAGLAASSPSVAGSHTAGGRGCTHTVGGCGVWADGLQRQRGESLIPSFHGAVCFVLFAAECGGGNGLREAARPLPSPHPTPPIHSHLAHLKTECTSSVQKCPARMAKMPVGSRWDALYCGIVCTRVLSACCFCLMDDVV